MCGINGIFSYGAAAPPIDRDELQRTREAMFARGPDAAGAWVSADGRVGLASRRLAILDLSAAGDQPMAGAGGRVQLVMNGEIYNFRQLRAELEAAGCRVRSSGDTEVVLALYLHHGDAIDAMLRRLRGMFALAIWDEREGRPRRLLLARDPLGIKPLYYSASSARSGASGQLRFASQVKALEAGGAVSPAVDPAGLAGFLLWGSVPEPWTIRRDVRALPAGHFLVIEEGRASQPRPFATLAGSLAGDATWSPGLTPGASTATGASGAISAIEESVTAHLVSDVPVAIFLSAGLDSGLVAALARRHLPEPPATFTLSFDVLAGTPRDEAPLAAEVARRLGTRHLEKRMAREDFARLWPAALAAMDQPSIDGFNTFAVSRAAHEAGLKVVLSGLGGDELFGSYPSFAAVPRWRRAARCGRFLPGLAAAWPALAARLAPGHPKLAGLLRHGATLPGSYFLRRALFLPEELPALMGREAAAEGLAAYDPIADAGKLVAAGLAAPAAPAGTGTPADPAAPADPGAKGHRPDRLDPWLAVQLMESSQYMRNQLLRDSDWASMACSVELRVPLVDAWLHRHLAAIGFQPARRLGKAALVRKLAPELPEALWHRPKTGFYIPVVEWLRPGELGPAGHNLGGRSRALARLVLAELGISLPASAGAPAA
ncbi:MAG TPA: asparagine synthase (glutamine-hydrolyzing), partial [Thermoanaerobaculia bacterium]|nr:asparagine synthase (glutamine-hydrolyzing) [Thermoanaerobaculia bacterium]